MPHSRFCLPCRSVPPRRGVSVVFCDVRGFTALAETMPSRELETALKQKLPVVTLLWYCARMAAGKFMGELG